MCDTDTKSNSNHRIFWSGRHRSNEKQAKTHCTHLYIMSPTIRCIISNFIEFYFLLCMVSFKKLLFHIRSVFICVWVQCCNEASKIFVLRRFLAKDPSSSSVHFKLSKNLRSFEDFRPKILKIFGIKSLFVEEILKEN